MKQPSATFTLAGRTLNAAEAGLMSVRVILLRGNHDSVELALWPKTKFSAAKPGDELSLQLGFKDDEHDVWSGKVTTVERTPSALLIVGHAPTAGLSRERKSNTYVGQTAGDIVRDLASSIQIDSVDGRAEFAYYAVDHRRSVWSHLLDLASLTGSEISCSPSGGLRFLDVNPLPSTTRFRYGADLLTWRAGPAVEGAAPSFAAHGSASESGNDKWHWLNPDPTNGAGGSQVVGAFHSHALAEGLTTAVSDRAKRARVLGEVELVGQADLRAGDVLSLSGLDDDPGPLRALAVRHTIDVATGFRTLLHVEGTGT